MHLCTLLCLAAAAPGARPLAAPSVAAVGRARVAVRQAFVPPDLVARLRDDASRLYEAGAFTTSGLTDTSKRKAFSATADRSVLSFGALEADGAGDGAARAALLRAIDGIRKQLAADLRRPTLRLEECYFSRYGPGAELARHLDEYHEELKGAKGWVSTTRRSVSWLVYLNDDWSLAEEGGGLSMELAAGADPECGAHCDDVQVGWQDGTQPVFLDSWIRGPGGAPLSAMYTTAAAGGARAYLSAPIDAHSAPGTPPAEHLRAQLLPEAAARFDPTAAERTAGGATERFVVSPSGAALALFDSVTVPHQVLAVTGARPRWAVAGWFHEEVQAFPEWLS